MNKKEKTDLNSGLPEQANPSSDKNFPIVGIGASAGGLAAFETFFSNMPERDTGMAFVLVQHLDPDHKSILTELVRRYTRMRVFEVEDGMKVEPDCTYIIPPNRNMTFQNGVLKLSELESPRGIRLPIDILFRSLASDLHENAICIVLSGTGSDGTLGLRSIKGEGGMAMVQSPDSTEHNGMLQSAIATGLVDFILPPAEMPSRLISYTGRDIGNTLLSKTKTDDVESSIKKICAMLRSKTGHEFSLYKKNTMIRRIERRMTVRQISDLDGYISLIQHDSDEVEALFRDLLIGVTNFFRDTEAFEELKKLLVQLINTKHNGSPVRVWVPGCSSGEEAYSIAILLCEQMEKLNKDLMVQIFATDIDGSAIKTARSGIYPASISADVPPEILGHYFSQDETGNYRIHKNIRDILIFSEQDVIKDPPFSKIDLISCRNLLIYLNTDLQKKIIQMFHYALMPEGYLFLGNSETVGEHSSMFKILDKKNKMFQKKEYAGYLQPAGRLVPSVVENEIFEKRIDNDDVKGKMNLRELAEQTMLQQFSAVGALVNERGDILYLHGRTGMFLEPCPGEIGANIIKMAREGLKHDLSSALNQAIVKKEKAVRNAVRVKTNSHFTAVDLTVRPVKASSGSLSLYMIIFEESANPAYEETIDRLPVNRQETKNGIESDIDMRIADLEKELHARDEYLQKTREELETTNEELMSSNEEMQSVNEELQSTNEELETSKEELQSINEELSVVNGELQAKVSDLGRMNNDMNNLLSGTGIGTIFVDHSLRILRFTPTVMDIINLIPSDIGRPVSHIVSNLAGYNRLTADVQEVLDTLIPKELEVQVLEGAWYILRIMPYRTIDNMIEGAVITFIDITERKKIEVDLGEKTRLNQILLDAFPCVALLIRPSDRMIIASNAAATRFGGTPGTNCFKTWWQNQDVCPWCLIPEKWDGESHHLEMEAKGVFWDVNWIPVDNDLYMHFAFDISESKRAEIKIRNLLDEKEIILQEVHHRIKNNMSTIYGLLSLQAGKNDDPAIVSALNDAGRRVQSMITLYDKLYQSAKFNEMPVNKYLPALIDQITGNFPNSSSVKVKKNIGDFILSSKTLSTMGIIINELLTNIMKYAFTGKNEGLIVVTALMKDDKVMLTVYDDGIGIPDTIDIENSTGFGLQLVSMLTKQMEGTIHLERVNGTKMIIEFPYNNI